MGEIINRVAASSLVTVNLEEFYPEGKRMQFDLKDFLWKGLVLKEKEFREELKNHNWEQYRDAFVAMNCSVDAILPGWAYLLPATYLQPVARKIVKGDSETLETALFTEIISKIDTTQFENKKVIIKGCSKKPVPESAFIQLIEKLQPVVSSLAFGEACSTVPLIKIKK